MNRLEEIVYEAGRAALADQEALVTGIRQRTGTLLAAQALVASFLGGAAIQSDRFGVWSWAAVVALVAGLVLAAGVLAPWRLVFAIDPRDLYDQLFEQVAAEEPAGGRGWLAAAGFAYQDLRHGNTSKVALISRLSGALSVLMVAQTLLWILALGLD